MKRKQVANNKIDKPELLAIPHISPDKVDRYGQHFLSLVRNSRKMLDDLVARQKHGGDLPIRDPNHENVVMISSDEENPDDGAFVEPPSSGYSASERSRFFEPDEEVAAFRDQSE